MTQTPPAGTESEEPTPPGGADMDLAPVEREAIQWVVRLTSGETNPADRAAFRRWKAQNPQHAAALHHALNLWLGVGRALHASRKPAAAPLRR